MAGLAVGGKTGLRVVWIGRGVVIGGVAAEAVRRGALESPAHMAGGAVERCVRSRQHESRELQMIERGARPAIHGMAGLARRRKIRCLVVGGLSILEVPKVATETVR